MIRHNRLRVSRDLTIYFVFGLVGGTSRGAVAVIVSNPKCYHMSLSVQAFIDSYLLQTLKSL
jgi:hypothetical protein